MSDYDVSKTQSVKCKLSKMDTEECKKEKEKQNQE